jgi:N6-adenosine-specific RNA methylase IME4
MKAEIELFKDQQDLERLEIIIEKGLGTFVDVGVALMQIRDAKLYKAGGYSRFNDYTKERWGFTKQYAGNLMRGAQTQKLLEGKTETIVSVLPTTETQVRPLTSLEPEQQVEVWERAVENAGGRIPTEKEVRAAIIELTPLLETPPLPAGKYGLIYADPPWQYEFSVSPTRTIERQYPTMTVEQICEMRPGIDEIAADDCVLFLWVTNPKLREGLRVIEEWGFDYKTGMVWVKDKIGMGYYARQQHELLLIAGRGKSQLPEPQDRPSSVITAPRLEHSAKPMRVYEIIEGMYPNYKKIELFAREHQEGWESWGHATTEI